MSQLPEENITCNYCENAVAESDDYCQNCGSLFVENFYCEKHPSTEAEGVCVICRTPYCGQCAEYANKVFLCAIHDGYEIYQGMARVYGVSDDAMAQYAHGILEQAGLHPFIYSRKASPLSVGGPGYTLFRASGEYDGHLINELKVMVPCSEVIEADRILNDLGIV